MKFLDAKKRMAQLMVAEAEACADGDDIQSGEPGRPLTIDSQAAHDAKLAREKFGQECAADPDLYGHLSPWMIDVHGTGPCEIDENSIELLMERPSEFTAQKGGGLAAAIEATGFEHGFMPSDRGAGGGHWHIGFPCDEAEATRLCAILHARFSKAIAKGLIAVRKKFWNWKFKGMPNWPAARAYLDSLDE